MLCARQAVPAAAGFAGASAFAAFAAAAHLPGLGLLFCWSCWVRSFGFWCQFVGFGAPGFAGAGVDPLDDELVGFAELGVLAAAGFERVQSPDVAAFELAKHSFEGFAVLEIFAEEAEVVEISGAIEGHLGQEVVFDGVGRAVVGAVGFVDPVVVVLEFLGEGFDGFGIEAGFE